MRKAGRLRFAVWRIVAARTLAVLVVTVPVPRVVWSATPRPKMVVHVRLRRTVTATTWGVGVEWDPYSYYRPTAENQHVIIKRLDFMRPSFLRVMGGISIHRGIVTTNPQLLLILRWAQGNNCKVILGQWGASPLVNGKNGLAEKLVYTWSKRIASKVVYLRRQRGFTSIHFYNFVNEPETVPIARWAVLARSLDKAFIKAGLGNEVYVIGPDTYGDPDWGADPGKRSSYNWPLLRPVARRAAGFIGAYDIHWYPENSEVIDGRIAPVLERERRTVCSITHFAAGMPFVVTEAGLLTGRCNGDQQPRVKTFGYGVLMADYAAQVFRAGWNGISAWDLDDAMHVVNGKPITHPPGKLTLKIWGFWNSQAAAMGDPADFDIRPWFYTWSLMSRLFPAGTRIVDSTEPAGTRRFRTLAGTRTVDHRLIINVALVNDVKKSRNITVRVPPAAHATTLTEYRYFRHDRPVDAQGLPIPAKILHNISSVHSVNIFMPGRGVVFLTNRQPFETR